MVMGVSLIFFIQWLFLGDLRSALIVVGHHPLRAAVRRGHPGAVGRVGEPAVDGRDRLRHHRRCDRDHGREHLPPSRRRQPGQWPRSAAGARRRHDRQVATIYLASSEVTQAIFFAATIIIAGFLPLFTLSGVEGHIFGPMAKTYAYALSGGLLATFTVSPALAALLLPEKVSETETIVVRGAAAGLRRRSIEVVLAHRGLTLARRRRAGRHRRPGRRARSGSSSCPSSRKATSGCAPRCRPRCRSTRATATSTACAASSRASPRSRPSISQHGRPDDGTDPRRLLQRRVLRAAEADASSGAAASTRKA